MANSQDTTTDIVDADTTDGSQRRSPAMLRTVSGPVLAAVLVAGLSGCGTGDNEAAAIDAAAAIAAPLDTRASLIVTVPIVTVPIVTTIPVDAAGPSTSPTVLATPMSNELAAFADSHGELIARWSDQLAAFGEDAPAFLDNVSAAPTAATAQDLSDQMVAALGTETSDPDLVTLRSFATDMSAAITESLGGDQDTAMTRFLGLQTQSESLSAVLTLIDG